MKVKTLLIFIFLIGNLKAQPHLEGKIDINLESGLFNCKLTLSNLPDLEQYKILLHRGMNIKYFKNDLNQLINYEGHYNGKMNGEAIEYYLADNSESKIQLPNSFFIEYLGCFPVYNDDYNAFDYKGVIAINNKTLRATEQSKWYPVIYDEVEDREVNSYTYNLTINIRGGKSIFINGSAPKKSVHSNFTSKKPYPLLLFAGNYDFINHNEDYIINDGVDSITALKLFDNIELIKKTLFNNLNQEFTDPIYIINHTSINQQKEGSSWGFNTYPSFAFTGIHFKDLINEDAKFSQSDYRFFGHEFSHNYFGNNVFSGNLSWFWLESFSEFLSYMVVEDICGKKSLSEILISETQSLQGQSFIPLHLITKKEDIGENYRYTLGPLLLKCFEDQFGRNKINSVIKNILEYSKTETLTLHHFKRAALESNISIKEYIRFENTFIRDKNFKQNIIERIISNHK